jgi:predicted DNA-binding protein with PD1-like motif
MESRLISEGALRTFQLVFQPGEEAVEGLAAFARKEALEFASFTAIGGFHAPRLGFYNLETKGFDDIPLFEDQVEVLSFIGEITKQGDEPLIHAHVVVGHRDGTTRGGHLMRGEVRPILIVTIEESPHLPQAHH